MTLALNLAGGIALAIWIYLLLFRGMFWRVAPLLDTWEPQQGSYRVGVVIPARNEADVIGQALASLHAQSLNGALSIFVVDDSSTDATARIAREHGAEVIEAGPLPTGWTGKLWAVSRGVTAALASRPDYLLLTDADIVHGSTSVRDLIARDVLLASTMVKLRCESVAERFLIPAFVFFFFKLYPPSWTADPKSSTAGAAGGCILIRPAALQDIGGIAAIRGELIDDCALAAAVKKLGPVHLGMASGTRSIRPYPTFASVWNMVARTAYTQLGYSPVLLIGTIVGICLTYVATPVLALCGFRTAAAAWLIMSAVYIPMLRFYGQPIVMAPLLPAVALFYLGATLHSAIRYWRGEGGQWKGRSQAPRG